MRGDLLRRTFGNDLCGIAGGFRSVFGRSRFGRRLRGGFGMAFR